MCCKSGHKLSILSVLQFSQCIYRLLLYHSLVLYTISLVRASKPYYSYTGFPLVLTGTSYSSAVRSIKFLHLFEDQLRLMLFDTELTDSVIYLDLSVA